MCYVENDVDGAAMLQLHLLHLSDQQVYCRLMCHWHQRFRGIFPGIRQTSCPPSNQMQTWNFGILIACCLSWSSLWKKPRASWWNWNFHALIDTQSIIEHKNKSNSWFHTFENHPRMLSVLSVQCIELLHMVWRYTDGHGWGIFSFGGMNKEFYVADISLCELLYVLLFLVIHVHGSFLV